MTYDAKEESVSDGAPIFLYEFSSGSETDYFTSRADDYTNDDSPPITYSGGYIEHTSIRSSQNFAKEDVTITFAASSSYAQTLMQRATDSVSFTLKRLHLTDSPADTQVIWKGFFVQAQRSRDRIQATFRPFRARADKRTTGWRTQRTCNHSVYSDPCGVDITAFQVTVTATAVSDRTYTVDDITGGLSPLPDNYWTGGVIEYDGQFRYIESFDVGAHTVTLTEPFLALSDAIDAGSPSVKLAPGCPLTRTVCNSRFNNLTNFLGAPEIPTRNRFAGERVDL